MGTFSHFPPSTPSRNDVKFAWKVQRDVEERGWTEEQVGDQKWL